MTKRQFSATDFFIDAEDIRFNKIPRVEPVVAPTVAGEFSTKAYVDGVAGGAHDQTLNTFDDVVFNSVSTDTINENTPTVGVTVDGVLLKDGLVDGEDVSALGTASHTHNQGLDTTDSPAFMAITTEEIEAPADCQLKLLTQGTSTSGAPNPNTLVLEAGTNSNAAVDSKGAAITISAGDGTYEGGDVTVSGGVGSTLGGNVFLSGGTSGATDGEVTITTDGIARMVAKNTGVEFSALPILVDVIDEFTPGAGVSVDGTLVKDGSINFQDGGLGRMTSADKSVPGGVNTNLINIFAGANTSPTPASVGGAAILSAGNGATGGNVQLEAGDGDISATKVGGDVYLQTGLGSTSDGQFQVRVGGAGGTDELIIPPAGIVEDNGTDEAIYRNASGHLVWRTVDAGDSHIHDQLAQLETTGSPTFVKVTTDEVEAAPTSTLLLKTQTTATAGAQNPNFIDIASGANSDATPGSKGAAVSITAGSSVQDGGNVFVSAGIGTVNGGDLFLDGGTSAGTDGDVTIRAGGVPQLVASTAGVDIASALPLLVDVVNETTAAAGVTVDGVLLKDSQVNTDQINEKTGGAGVTIDSVLCKDNQVTASQVTASILNADVINEKTGATGVTVDGVLLRDGLVDGVDVAALPATTGFVNHTFTQNSDPLDAVVPINVSRRGKLVTFQIGNGAVLYDNTGGVPGGPGAMTSGTLIDAEYRPLTHQVGIPCYGQENSVDIDCVVFVQDSGNIIVQKRNSAIFTNTNNNGFYGGVVGSWYTA